MSSTKKKIDGRGRKAGVTDIVFVSLEALLRHAKPTTVVQVRRKWLEQFEEFNGVSFDLGAVTPQADKVTVKVAEESLSSEKDSIIRPRIEMQEEQL